MTILTDGTHLISDTSLEELHTFALDKLHFREEWFQDMYGHQHYDLTTPNARNRAIRNGAILMTSQQLWQALLDAPYNAEYKLRKRHTR